MRAIKKGIIATTTNLLVLIVCFSLALPAQAATLAEVEKALAGLKSALAEYQAVATTGQVLGASVITVSTDAELANALASVTGGETIKLNPGTYSAVNIQIPYNRLQVGTIYKSGAAKSPASTVTITSANPSNRAVLESIRTDGASNYRIEGLSFRPSTNGTAATLAGKNQFIGNDISFGDSDSWTKENWLAIPGNGISVNGPDTEVAYNNLRGVNFGIVASYDADNINVHHNKIVNFKGDAFRGLGEYGVFEHNYAANSFGIDANHDDMFQSWAYDPVTKSVGKGVNRGMKIRYNTFINSLSDNPLRGTAQGIGLFDGPFEDWVVENNLVIVSHWHGISLYGAKNTSIQNNVVLDPDQTTPGPSWVKFFAQKNGTVYAGNKLVRNYANSISTATSSSATTTVSDNKTVKYADYGNYFVDHTKGDYTIKSGAIPFAVGAVLGSGLAPEPKVTTLKNPSSGTSGQTATTSTSATTTTTTPPASGGGTATGALTPSCEVTTDKSSYKIGDAIQVTWKGVNASFAMFEQGAASSPQQTVPTGTLSLTGTQTVKANVLGQSMFVLNLFKTQGGAAVARCTVAITVTENVAIPPVTDRSVTVVGMSDRQTVTGVIKIEAKPVSFTKVTKVTFTIDNTLVTTEVSAPYALGGDDGIGKLRGYDTTKLANGDHTLTVVVTGDNTTVKKVLSFSVQNQVNAQPVLTSTVIYTTDTIAVRSTPNGTRIGAQLAGVRGVRLAEAPVIANGISWVKVDFETGSDGYVANQYLTTVVPGSVVTTPSTSSVQAQIDALMAQVVALQALLTQLMQAR